MSPPTVQPQQAIQSPAAQQFVQSQIPSPTSGYNAPPTAPASVPKPAESEYLKYMRSMFNPQELERQQKERDRTAKQSIEAQKRLDDIRNQSLSLGLEGREAYEGRLDQAGGTVAGAQQGAGLISRRTNADLARLAVRESAAANTLNAATSAQQLAEQTYNAMLDAGATVYDAEQAAIQAGEGFTLSEGQTRYDAQGNVIAGGGSNGAGGYSPGANPTVDAWVKLVKDGSAKIDNVPSELRGSVAVGRASSTEGDDPKWNYVSV